MGFYYKVKIKDATSPGRAFIGFRLGYKYSTLVPANKSPTRLDGLIKTTIAPISHRTIMIFLIGHINEVATRPVLISTTSCFDILFAMLFLCIIISLLRYNNTLEIIKIIPKSNVTLASDGFSQKASI